jgi:DNA-binding NarL/FixJ family response regulator
MTINILIVDDHPMVRRGLKSLLSSYPDLQIIGEAENGAAALALTAKLAPDIVLLDIQMPELDGVQVAQRLRSVSPQTKVIALTAFDNEDYVASAMQAGVYAYLLKSHSDDTIADSIRRVYAGERLLDSAHIEPAHESTEEMAQLNAKNEMGLTRQDLAVLKLIARGATNDEIAHETNWSDRTVKREIEQIMTKLGARNRAHAVSEAIKRGLV